MVSNDIVMPLVLKRHATPVGEPSDGAAQLLTTRRIAIFVILLLAYIYYRSAGEAQLAAIGLLSFAAVAQLAPAFFGGLIWRRGTALRRDRRHERRHPGLGLYAAAAEHFGSRHCRRRNPADGPWGLDLLRPQALFGIDLPPLVHGVLLSLGGQYRLLYRLLVGPPPVGDRAGAGGSVRAVDAGADGAELSAAARLGHGRGIDLDRRPLSRRGAHPRILRQLRPDAPHQPGAAGGGRLPAPAICRISAGLGDRRGVVAARAVAVAAQAHACRPRPR